MSEAIWRLLQFPMHSGSPAVDRLPFHLENKQGICFADCVAGDLNEMLGQAQQDSKYTAWLRQGLTSSCCHHEVLEVHDGSPAYKCVFYICGLCVTVFNAALPLFAPEGICHDVKCRWCSMLQVQCRASRWG